MVQTNDRAKNKHINKVANEILKMYKIPTYIYKVNKVYDKVLVKHHLMSGIWPYVIQYQDLLAPCKRDRKVSAVQRKINIQARRETPRRLRPHVGKKNNVDPRDVKDVRTSILS